MTGMSVVQLIHKAAENRSWVTANYANLTKKYRDRWVAILDNAVIDNDKELQKLAKRLRVRLGKRYAEVAMEYVTEKPVVMVLVI